MKSIKFIILVFFSITLIGCNNTNNMSKQINNSNKNININSSKEESYTSIKNNISPSLDSSHKVSQFKTNQTITSIRQPIKICDDGKNSSVIEAINSILVKDLNIDSSETDSLDIHKSVYAVYFKDSDDKIDQYLIAITNSNIFLFETNIDYTNIKYLDRIEDIKINLSDCAVNYKDNRIQIISNNPFDAVSTTYFLEWNDIKFKIAETITEDKTKEFYSHKKELVNDDNIYGLMTLAKYEEKLINPKAYEDFYVLPKKILILANNTSLELYNDNNLEEAFNILQYGIDQYSNVWFEDSIINLSSDKILENYSSLDSNNTISLSSFASIYNNYAFYLSEMGKNKESEILLKRLIEISPERTVAYLNLGDVEWDLDKRDDAKKYYNIYLNLLEDTETPPNRVLERTK